MASVDPTPTATWFTKLTSGAPSAPSCRRYTATAQTGGAPVTAGGSSTFTAMCSPVWSWQGCTHKNRDPTRGGGPHGSSPGASLVARTVTRPLKGAVFVQHEQHGPPLPSVHGHRPDGVGLAPLDEALRALAQVDQSGPQALQDGVLQNGDALDGPKARLICVGKGVEGHA
eukprot:834164-Pyramimonas_sp.AAC.2